MCCDWNAFLTREQVANQKTVFDDQINNEKKRQID